MSENLNRIQALARAEADDDGDPFTKLKQLMSSSLALGGDNFTGYQNYTAAIISSNQAQLPPAVIKNKDIFMKAQQQQRQQPKTDWYQQMQQQKRAKSGLT